MLLHDHESVELLGGDLHRCSRLSSWESFQTPFQVHTVFRLNATDIFERQEASALVNRPDKHFAGRFEVFRHFLHGRPGAFLDFTRSVCGLRDR